MLTAGSGLLALFFSQPVDAGLFNAGSFIVNGLGANNVDSQPDATTIVVSSDNADQGDTWEWILGGYPLSPPASGVVNKGYSLNPTFGLGVFNADTDLIDVAFDPADHIDPGDIDVTKVSINGVAGSSLHDSFNGHIRVNGSWGNSSGKSFLIVPGFVLNGTFIPTAGAVQG